MAAPRGRSGCPLFAPLVRSSAWQEWVSLVRSLFAPPADLSVPHPPKRPPTPPVDTPAVISHSTNSCRLVESHLLTSTPTALIFRPDNPCRLDGMLRGLLARPLLFPEQTHAHHRLRRRIQSLLRRRQEHLLEMARPQRPSSAPPTKSSQSSISPPESPPRPTTHPSRNAKTPTFAHFNPPSRACLSISATSSRTPPARFSPTRAPATGPNQILRTEEKASDVNLAVHLLNDAWNDLYDCAVVVDGDLAEAIRLAKADPAKRVGIATPGHARTSKALRAADIVRRVRPGALRSSRQIQFPAPTTW